LALSISGWVLEADPHRAFSGSLPRNATHYFGALASVIQAKFECQVLFAGDMACRLEGKTALAKIQKDAPIIRVNLHINQRRRFMPSAPATIAGWRENWDGCSLVHGGPAGKHQ
jgi:hypothetical protein